MIKLENIHLAFDDKKIFEGFNLSIPEGQHTCISGASGTGKSTLLRLIIGHQIPDKGEVKINNELVNPLNINSIREQVVWVPQNVNLSVESGIELITMMGISDQKEKIIDIGNQLGLKKYLFLEKFSNISGGQKQRVIISICLSLDRPIILMDEPTSSLDEGSMDLLIKLVESLNHKTIVSISHNNKWIQIADKIVEL